MGLDELNKGVREFCERREWEQYHTPKELSIGMVNESSELLELFRFKETNEQFELLNDPANREDIEDEIADVLFFTLRFADLYDINLEEALSNKIEKNEERYPEKEYKQSNKKYDQ
jgi:NTP pyrophosphatase (non-canonical NTP hydrolase)